MYKQNKFYLLLIPLVSLITLVLIFFITNGSKRETISLNNRIKVGVFDGRSTDSFTVPIIKKSYAKSDSENSTHSNIVWGILLKGLSSDKIECFEYSIVDKNGSIDKSLFKKALLQAEKDKVEIINFSGGFYDEDDEIEALIIKQQKRGLVFVAAAGNDPMGIVDFPARMDQVIAVGSKEMNKVSSFSPQKGIDVYGKGGKVSYKNQEYQGTSFAAPEVTNKIIKESIKSKKDVNQASETIKSRGD